MLPQLALFIPTSTYFLKMTSGKVKKPHSGHVKIQIAFRNERSAPCPLCVLKGRERVGLSFWGPLVYWISIILCPKKQYLLCTDSLVSVDADQGSVCLGGGIF